MKVLFLSDLVPDLSLEMDQTFIDLIIQSDYVVFNLEGSPLTKTKADRKNQLMSFSFDQIVDFAEKFGKTKIILALANNHILDNGSYGFDFLIRNLDQYGIKYFGTKEKPFIHIESKLSILNFVTAETVAKYKSNRKLNYLFYSPRKINRQISILENSSNCLVLYPHWGRDMDRTIFPTYNFKFKANRWFIFGHHSHVISDVKKNFIYSLGNTFIPHPYYYKKYPASKFGLAINLDVERKTYDTFITQVAKKDNFSISVKKFGELPDIVLNHGNDFSINKKKFLQFLSFRGNLGDFFKLVFLQLMILLFQVKIKFKSL